MEAFDHGPMYYGNVRNDFNGGRGGELPGGCRGGRGGGRHHPGMRPPFGGRMPLHIHTLSDPSTSDRSYSPYTTPGGSGTPRSNRSSTGGPPSANHVKMVHMSPKGPGGSQGDAVQQMMAMPDMGPVRHRAGRGQSDAGAGVHDRLENIIRKNALLCQVVMVHLRMGVIECFRKVIAAVDGPLRPVDEGGTAGSELCSLTR